MMTEILLIKTSLVAGKENDEMAFNQSRNMKQDSYVVRKFVAISSSVLHMYHLLTDYIFL